MVALQKLQFHYHEFNYPRVLPPLTFLGDEGEYLMKGVLTTLNDVQTVAEYMTHLRRAIISSNV